MDTVGIGLAFFCSGVDAGAVKGRTAMAILRLRGQNETAVTVRTPMAVCRNPLFLSVSACAILWHSSCQ